MKRNEKKKTLYIIFKVEMESLIMDIDLEMVIKTVIVDPCLSILTVNKSAAAIETSEWSGSPA